MELFTERKEKSLGLFRVFLVLLVVEERIREMIRFEFAPGTVTSVLVLYHQPGG